MDRKVFLIDNSRNWEAVEQVGEYFVNVLIVFDEACITSEHTFLPKVKVACKLAALMITP